MPIFEYKGKTLAGAAVQGQMKANSREDLERVFDRFHALDREGRRGGSGLGLTIVHRLCERMDWQISVSHEILDGSGDRFACIPWRDECRRRRACADHRGRVTDNRYPCAVG